MVQIKGSVIQETISQIKSRAGDDALKKILGLLDDETRKVFEGEIFASTWYSLDLFTRFLKVRIISPFPLTRANPIRNYRSPGAELVPDNPPVVLR